ncbi:hypothetical protein VCR3J2_310273 [Vibrio coralliirubri]|nr:hypothetical protein VCR3J2_310273 [Vibrio coralliirubri]
MLEIFQFAISGFWVFAGSTLFFCSGVMSIGWGGEVSDLMTYSRLSKLTVKFYKLVDINKW